MDSWTIFAALAILIGVPSFIAGWLCGGFHDLRRLDKHNAK